MIEAHGGGGQYDEIGLYVDDPEDEQDRPAPRSRAFRRDAVPHWEEDCDTSRIDLCHRSPIRLSPQLFVATSLPSRAAQLSPARAGSAQHYRSACRWRFLTRPNAAYARSLEAELPRSE